jgi:hypothetical protein
MSSGYDFGQLYGQADNSNVLYPENTPLDAIVSKSEWGRTRDGTKGQWAVEFRTSTGENAGRMPIQFPMSVSADNPRSLGIMFRHMAALGIPVPDPQDPNKVVNGQVPFWMMGWTPEQIAQAMLGRPVTLFIKHDEYEGVTRNKVRDVRPPRPGAPTDWPRPQMQQPQAPGYGPPPGYGQPQPYGQQMAPQPWQQPQAPAAQPPPQQPAQAPPWAQHPQGYPVQPGQQYQAQAQYPPQQFQGGPGVAGPPAQAGYPGQPAGAPVGQPPIPGAPEWAQPAVPGAGGGAEFTPQGQSYQPGTTPPPQPPWAAQQPQQAPQQPQQGYPQQGQPSQPVPPQPPWAQQAQQPPQNGYPGQPQPQGPQPGQQPGEQPPIPPWMQ